MMGTLEALTIRNSVPTERNQVLERISSIGKNSKYWKETKYWKEDIYKECLHNLEIPNYPISLQNTTSSRKCIIE